MEYTVIQVCRGDTIKSIVQKYQTTERSLFLLNHNPKFFDGERLIVLKNSNTYTVKPFDTLLSIANKNATTVQEIKKINNNITEVFLGQTIFLP